MFGACVDRDAARYVHSGLVSLQHRGQESAGIAVFDGHEIHIKKGMGLVSEVFGAKDFDELCGNSSIGHALYASAANKSYANAQPFVFRYIGGMFAVTYDGQINNAAKLRDELGMSGAVFQSTSDVEVVGSLLARYHSLGMAGAIARSMDDLSGAYSIIVLSGDKIYAARDPHGFKPLVIGQNDHGYFVSSETCALDTIRAKRVRDIKPGEIVEITKDDVKSVYTVKPKNDRGRATCVFEYVYFARPDSIIEGINVNTVRNELGKQLARDSKVKADVVVPVPESGVAAAIGYAEESGIPFNHAIIKNRYVGRTFIQPTQSERENAVDLKLNFVREAVEGKRVILVDDSIVRGTTSARLINLMRRAGATEVHLMVCSPPVKFPCKYGINTTDRKELVAATKSVDEICDQIGADSVHYISVEGISNVMSKLCDKVCRGENGCDHSFCMACFTGDYPDARDRATTLSAEQEEKLLSLSYGDSGVNIDAGNYAVELIKPYVKNTRIPGVMGDIGGFGGLFNLDLKEFKDPVLVTGTDGVGTKLKLAFMMDKHDTVGIDAVAMCVNDILVSGARPLFFLDYIGCGKLEPTQIADIVKGVADGCVGSGCALVGGETAEMPGFYPEGEYDIAGFAVGAVSRENIIDGTKIKPGDIVIGLPSSGVHSNGFSLVRRVLLDSAGMSLNDVPPCLGEKLGDVLLTPTRLYAKPIMKLLEKVEVLGMAHITGGGLIENPPRMLHEGTAVQIDTSAWQAPKIFELIRNLGNVDIMEMYRVFNMGIGFMVVVRPEDARETVKLLKDFGEDARVIGKITEGNKEVELLGVS